MSSLASSCVALAGGGTAGHVSAHLALIPQLRSRGLGILYFGCDAIAKPMLAAETDLQFRSVPAGKLRRYLSWRNCIDVFKTAIGIVVSVGIILKHKPVCLISRGGYVSFPPMVASILCRVPIITIEADLSLGLASRLCYRFAKKTLCAFEETAQQLTQHYPQRHHVWTGLPINPKLLQGDREQGLALCQFDTASRLPILLVMGGSQGSQQMESRLAHELNDILASFRVIFLGGTQGGAPSGPLHQAILGLKPAKYRDRIKIFGFINQSLAHLYAASDIALSRAGAHSLFELIYNQIPTLFIPLEAGSRGEQLENATAMHHQGVAHMVRSHELKEPQALLSRLLELDQHATNLKQSLQAWCHHQVPMGTAKVMAAISEYLPSP